MAMAAPPTMAAVAITLLTARTDRPVSALPMLQPAASVPPTPISAPPAKRRPSSAHPGARQDTGPRARALSQVPSGMPTTSAVPQPAAPGMPRTVLSMSERLGPVIDSPQPQPATDPESHASSPTQPSANPVTGHVHASDRVARDRPTRPRAITPSSNAIVVQRGSAIAASTDGARPTRVLVSRSLTESSGPWLAAVAPRASPSAVAPAPRLPAPTRDQTEVAQPLPATMPTPNTRPPTTAAAGVTGGSGRGRGPAA